MGTKLPPPKKKGGHSPLIFGKCLLWPNGWMDQDATWYGGRPRPRRLCVRWERSSPLPAKKGHSPQFSAHVCCGQAARWIRMSLGREVGLGPGDTVLDGNPAPPKKGTVSSFRPMFIVRRGPIPPQKGHSMSPSFRPISIVVTVTHLSNC